MANASIAVDERSSVARLPDGPRSFPLVGELQAMRRDPLSYFVQLSHNYCRAAKFNIGLDRVQMLNDPQYIRHVLQDNHQNYHKSKFYEPLRPLLGDRIFLSEGKQWLSQRRIAKPAFGGPQFRKMARQITDVTGEMLGDWHASHACGMPVNVAADTMRMTLDAVTRSMLNVHLTGKHSAIYDALSIMLCEAERRVWSVVNLPLSITKRINREYREALQSLDHIVGEIIDDRRQNRYHEDDLLSTLIKAYDTGATADRKVLRDQVLSIILSGHETTAIALSWSCHLISTTPHVRRRLEEEVAAVLGDRTPTYDDLGRLTYTRMVFEEAMRLYPPVWTTSRTALDDDFVGDLKIPRNSTVMLCAYAVHRHPDFWHNPDEFDPERFSAEQVESRPRYTYFPFGGGPRSCLGSRFATMEAQLALAMITQRYRLEPAQGPVVTPEPMITLRPRDGVWMRLHSRETPAREQTS